MTSSSIPALLSALDSSMDAIKGLTRVVLQDLSKAPQVVEAWRVEFENRLMQDSTVLPVVYACNDIVQESKKNGSEFVDAFSPVLAANFRQALLRRPEQRKNFVHLVKLWIAREVFPKHVLRELVEALELHEVAAEDVAELEEVQGSSRGAEAAGDDLEATELSAEELQAQCKRAIESGPLSRLLGLRVWVAKEFGDADKVAAQAQDALREFERCVQASPQSVEAVEKARERVQESVAAVKRLTLANDIHGLVHDALIGKLEEALERAAQGLERAGAELEQGQVVSSAIRDCEPFADEQGQFVATYSWVRVVPKPLKRKATLAEDSALLSVAMMRQRELDVDKAVQSGKAMKYHKGLQKYVPMPKDGELEDWR
jgi:hypothetical protein